MLGLQGRSDDNDPAMRRKLADGAAGGVIVWRGYMGRTEGWVMRSRIALAIITISVLAFGSVYAISMDVGGKVTLSLNFDGEKIGVALANDSGKNIYLMLPLNITPEGGGGGVEYVLIDSNNKRHELCSNINPVRTMERELLAAGDSVEINYSVKTMAKMYCLDRGGYKLMAIYHNFMDREEWFSIASNEINIMVP